MLLLLLDLGGLDRLLQLLLSRRPLLGLQRRVCLQGPTLNRAGIGLEWADGSCQSGRHGPGQSRRALHAQLQLAGYIVERSERAVMRRGLGTAHGGGGSGGGGHRCARHSFGPAVEGGLLVECVHGVGEELALSQHAASGGVTTGGDDGEIVQGHAVAASSEPIGLRRGAVRLRARWPEHRTRTGAG